MESYELYKKENHRVVVYKSPLELLRLIVLLIYLITPIWFTLSLYKDGDLFGLFAIVLVVILSWLCWLGVFNITTEHYDITNKIWRPDYARASVPATFITSFIFSIAILESNYIDELINTWLSWLNLLSIGVIFIAIFTVSYFTQSITTKRNSLDKFSTSIAIGFGAIIFIFLLAFSLSLWLFTLAALTAFLVAFLLSLYPRDVNYYN